MSKIEKFGMIIVLNCALLMLVGTMMSMSKDVTTEEFFNTSGTFLMVLSLLWNALVIHLVFLSTANNEG